MYEQTWSLACGDRDDAEIFAFIGDMASFIGSGRGRKSALATTLDMADFDVLRFLIGATDDWLTTPRQRFAEAAWAFSFGGTLDAAHQRWTAGQSWMPVNPRAHHEPLTACLDLEFMDRFAISNAGWERALSVPGLMSRAASDQLSQADTFRVVVALSMFGFTDPMQFFAKVGPR